MEEFNTKDTSEFASARDEIEFFENSQVAFAS